MQNNMKIDFLSSDTYKTAQVKKSIDSSLVKYLRYILYLLGFFIVVILIINLLIDLNMANWINSIMNIFVSVVLFILMIDIYISFHKDDKLKVKLSDAINLQDDKINLAEYLDTDDIGEILCNAIEIAKKNKVNLVDPLIILLAFQKSSFGSQMMLRCSLFFNNESEKKLIDIAKKEAEAQNQKKLVFSEASNRILIDSLQNANIRKENFADLGDLFLSLTQNVQVNKAFEEKGLKKEDIQNIVIWYRRMIANSKTNYFWQKKYYGGGIGQEWASGYTPVLNYFSKNISEYLLDAKLQAIATGHKPVIDRIQEVLVKSGQNNVMLLGEEGVGKRTLVNAFAQKVIRGQVLPFLRYKHVIELDTGQLLAGANEAELQQRFIRILGETQNAGNIILFVNNFDNLVNPEVEQVGTIDASQFLIPYLKSDRLQIIATANYDSWHRKIEVNQTIANSFTKINVIEPNNAEMLPVLQDAVGEFEYKNKVFFTYNALKSVIALADRYVHDEVFPQKAIDLVQAISVKFASLGQLKIINDDDVQQYIADRFKVPAKEASEKEKEKLLNLESELHKRLIDQQEAVNLIANSLRRARAGLSKKNKPIGSFLFVGPTGVGKTETAKALADIYFGSEKNMIRFDMSEFQEISSISRLIGSGVGKQKEQGLLSVAIRENPYTVLLFDEIEKAHPNILNLFLQMLDEGTLTDATGRKLNFTNAIIICTSNAGAEQIRQYLKTDKPLDKLSSIILDYLQKENLFRPEFLNRFDSVVCYKPLSQDDILEVAKLMLKKLQGKLKEKDIALEFTPNAILKLAKLGYEPTLGARPMARVIQDKVENMLATKMLEGSIKNKQKVLIDEKDIK